MAEEDKRGAREEEEETTGEATPKKSLSTRAKVSIIAGGALALILAIGTPILILSLRDQPKEEQQYLGEQAAVEAEYQKLQMEGYLDDDLSDGEELIGAIFPLETFVVNLKGGGYLRTQIQLEFHRRDIPHRFYSRLVPMRDGMITLLASRTRDEVSTEEGRDQLKRDVQELVNRMLRRAEVKEVYFTQFVIQ